jgi:hypothetical protein
MTASPRKIVKENHVALFNVASALLALENIELPLAARPPIPSPFGLCRRTSSMSNNPLDTQIQERTEISM